MDKRYYYPIYIIIVGFVSTVFLMAVGDAFKEVFTVHQLSISFLMQKPEIKSINIEIEAADISRIKENALLQSIVDILNYKVLGELKHRFTPQGYTGILMLSESHISIHTWPEKGYAYLELVSCKSFGEHELELMKGAIKEHLPDAKLTHRVISNGS